MIPSAPPAVRWIIRTLEDAGFDTWAVGGAVRDTLAGRAGGDWDLTTRAHPEQVRKAFKRTVPIGIEHGTVGVLTRDDTLYEVTTFRRDVETFGRHAVVEFAEELEEDLARRDFTINAIAWHPLREELRDPFGGAEDLEARVLRTVGDAKTRFGEDYLRVLRALRFAGHFEMTIEEDTWVALCGCRDQLPRLSPERVREELTKILVSSPRPSRALSLYAAAGILPVLYPELDPCVGYMDDGDGLDAWSRGLLMADAAAMGRPLVRLACFLHPVGFPRTGPVTGDSPGVRGALRTAAMMGRLRYSRASTDKVAALVGTAAQPPRPGAAPAELRRWLSEVRFADLHDLARVWIAKARVDARSGDDEASERVTARWRAIRGELAGHPPLTVNELALDGRSLIAMGLRPSPRFGEILAHLLDLVLEDPTRNEQKQLVAYVEKYLEGHPEGDA